MDDIKATIIICFQHFLKADGQIISKAEEQFNAILTSHPPEDILRILYQIVRENPQNSIGLQAIIQFSRFFSLYCINVSRNDEFIREIRNLLLDSFINDNFDKTHREYLLATIFACVSIPGLSPPFPEFVPFLHTIFRIPHLYYYAISLFIVIPHSGFIEAFLNSDQNYIEYLLSHLSPETNESEKSSTLIIILKHPGLFDLHSIDFLSYLEQLSGNDLMRYYSQLNSTFLNGQIDIDCGRYLQWHYHHLQHNSDELFKIRLASNFGMITLLHKNMFDYFSNEEEFITFFVITASNPAESYDLYNESRNTLTFLFKEIPDVSKLLPMCHLFIQKNENPYLSSMFLSCVIDPQYIELGLRFSTHEDKIIRDNGLRYIRKLVKRKIYKEISEEDLLGIGSVLLQSYQQFSYDENIILTFSVYGKFIPKEILFAFYELIQSLLQNIITAETIRCGTLFLTNTDQNFLNLLVKCVFEYLSQGRLLSSIMPFIPIITRYMNMADRISFYDQIMPYICNDPDCLYSKIMEKVHAQLEGEFNRYEKIILDNYVDITNPQFDWCCANEYLLANSLSAISTYAIDLPLFRDRILPLTEIITTKFQLIENLPVSVTIAMCEVLTCFLAKFDDNKDIFELIINIDFHNILSAISALDCLNAIIQTISQVAGSPFLLLNEFYSQKEIDNQTIRLIDLFLHILEVSSHLFNIEKQDSCVTLKNEVITVSCVLGHTNQLYRKLLNVNETMTCELFESLLQKKETFTPEIIYALLEISHDTVINSTEVNSLRYLEPVLSILLDINNNLANFESDFISQVYFEYRAITVLCQILFLKEVSIEIVVPFLNYLCNIFNENPNWSKYILVYFDLFVCIVSKYGFRAELNSFRLNYLQLILSNIQSIDRFNNYLAQSLFTILLNCIKIEQEPFPIAQQFMTELCLAIQHKKIDDTGIDGIMSALQNHPLPQTFRPLYLSIQEFKSSIK